METIRFFQFNTLCEVTLYDERPDARALLAAAKKEAAAVRHLLDFYDDASELGRLNTGAQKGVPFPVSAQLYFVIREMLHFAKQSHGWFDPTVAPLVCLWDITAPNPCRPNDNALARAQQKCGWQKVLLQPDMHSVTFTHSGMALDAGGAGKGYAVDRVARLLKSHGVQSASINFGGNLYLLGRCNGRPWRVGVQAPGQKRGQSLGTLQLQNCAVSTSGGYDRFFVQNGQAYHHLLNPATGRPQNNGLEAVTIVSPSALQADMLSTACFVGGKDAGRELAAQMEETGWLAVEKQGEITACNRLLPAFTGTKPNRKVC